MKELESPGGECLTVKDDMRGCFFFCQISPTLVDSNPTHVLSEPAVSHHQFYDNLNLGSTKYGYFICYPYSYTNFRFRTVAA